MPAIEATGAAKSIAIAFDYRDPLPTIDDRPRAVNGSAHRRLSVIETWVMSPPVARIETDCRSPWVESAKLAAKPGPSALARISDPRAVPDSSPPTPRVA
jgi:hypothetical protein